MKIRDRIKSLRRVKASELLPNPKNWRTHPKAQRDALRGLLAEIGFAGAALARETPEGLQLIDGHLRAELAPDAKIPVLVLNVTAEEADKILATFDPVGAMAEASQERLGELLREIETNSKPLQAMLDALAVENQIDLSGAAQENTPDPEPQIDRAAELLKTWKVKRGQVWEIPGKAGVHRVMCGDATEEGDVGRVMGGGSLAALFTDPPYGINAVKPNGRPRGGGMPGGKFARKGTTGVDGVAKRGQYDQIQNDEKPFDPTHLLEAAPILLLFGGNHYADQLPRSSRWLVWDKKNDAASGTFFSDAELIWTNLLGVRCTVYRHTWSGMIRQGAREIELPQRMHPSQKPVGLLVEIMRDCIKQNGPIGDWYLGSGTTLIAAEQLGRVCYGMEIEPKYVAVTLQRANDAGLSPTLTP